MEETKSSLLDELLKLKAEESTPFSNLSNAQSVQLLNEIATWLTTNKDKSLSIDTIVSEFEIAARQYIISKKMKNILLKREEELLATLYDVQGRLDEYNEATKDMNEKQIQIKYTNQQLLDINQLRTQMIPGMFLELENLVSAIKANEDIYDGAKEDLFYQNAKFSIEKINHRLPTQ